MSSHDNNIAISYFIEENEQEANFNIEDIINEINENKSEDEFVIPLIINYNDNYTVKELLTICEYYGFAKDLKANRFNKEQIVEYLVSFENDIANTEIVFRRQNMWFFINELKNDKFMKKFVLW